MPTDEQGDKWLTLEFLDKELNETVRKIEAYEKRLFAHKLHGQPETEKLMLQVDQKQKLTNEIRIVFQNTFEILSENFSFWNDINSAKKKELKKARQVIQLDELKARKRVLRRLGYATAADVIETKGRVACEIATADEVLSQLKLREIYIIFSYF